MHLNYQVVLSSRFADIADSALASEYSRPEDSIEPDDSINLYREAAKRFIWITIGAIQFLRDACSAEELRMRIDVLSYVFQHPSVKNHSLTTLGKQHNKTRAAISAQILNFQRANALPPTLAQKSTQARQSYTQARRSKLK